MGMAALQAVGSTPLLHLPGLSPPDGGQVWAKWEGANPTGSMKDRMALGMIEHGESTGALGPGMRVVDFTGGSTGSSLAMVCAAKGLRAHLVTSDAFAIEKTLTMRALGATVDVVPSVGGAVTPDLFVRMRERVDELRAEPGTYWTDQFNNPGNAHGYRALGQEILADIDPDAFVMGVGTGGCFSGVAAALKETRTVRCVAVEPASSRNLSFGPTGPHRLEGIGTGNDPPALRRDLIDGIEAVSNEDAYETAREIARTEGLLCGITSGANVRAAQRVAGSLPAGAVVVTVLVDSGLKYLAGDLFS